MAKSEKSEGSAKLTQTPWAGLSLESARKFQKEVCTIRIRSEITRNEGGKVLSDLNAVLCRTIGYFYDKLRGVPDRIQKQQIGAILGVPQVASVLDGRPGSRKQWLLPFHSAIRSIILGHPMPSTDPDLTRIADEVQRFFFRQNEQGAAKVPAFFRPERLAFDSPFDREELASEYYHLGRVAGAGYQPALLVLVAQRGSGFPANDSNEQGNLFARPLGDAVRTQKLSVLLVADERDALSLSSAKQLLKVWENGGRPLNNTEVVETPATESCPAGSLFTGCCYLFRDDRYSGRDERLLIIREHIRDNDEMPYALTSSFGELTVFKEWLKTLLPQVQFDSVRRQMAHALVLEDSWERPLSSPNDLAASLNLMPSPPVPGVATTNPDVPLA